MKTLKLLFTALTIFTAFSIHANNGEELVLKEVGNRVRQAVKMPESMKGKNGSHKVTVNFLVNEEGKVTEVQAQTKDKDAKRDLENQFLHLTFKELAPCVRHSIDVNFLLL